MPTEPIVYPLTAAAAARMVPCGCMIEPVASRCDEPPNCEKGHDLSVEHCGQVCPDYVPGLNADERTRCEVWSRVMGYHRPVSAFNAGKQAEHRERQAFSEQPTGRRVPSHLVYEGAGHD